MVSVLLYFFSISQTSLWITVALQDGRQSCFRAFCKGDEIYLVPKQALRWHSNYWLCGEIKLLICEIWGLAAPVPQLSHCFCFFTRISPPWGFLFMSSQRWIALESLCSVWGGHKHTNLYRGGKAHRKPIKNRERLLQLRERICHYTTDYSDIQKSHSQKEGGTREGGGWL